MTDGSVHTPTLLAERSLVSVILPTYNEVENIVSLVHEVQGVMRDRPVEIVIVDDDSPDGTARCASNAFRDDPTVRLVVRTDGRGLGTALGRGVAEATGDVLVLMDTDFNHQPKYLPVLVENTTHYDCVLGSRFLYGGLMRPRSRHLLSWLFNVFVRAATRGQVTDNLYGFLAIHRSVLASLPAQAVFAGHGDYCIRLSYYLQQRRATILQVPMVNGNRRAGEGSRAFLQTLLRYTRATLRLTFPGR